jgi:hypothetical protein
MDIFQIDASSALKSTSNLPKTLVKHNNPQQSLVSKRHQFEKYPYPAGHPPSYHSSFPYHPLRTLAQPYVVALDARHHSHPPKFLSFNDNRMFAIIGSDGGLLEHSIKANTLRLAPAERVEILVDVSDGAYCPSLSPDKQKNHCA